MKNLYKPISDIYYGVFFFVFCLILVNYLQTPGFSQDIHFSQFQQSPLLVNPALTGNFNGDQRIILNYKNQWKSINSPYRTYAFSGDAGLFKKQWKNAYLGTGIYIFSDKAGDSNLGITQYNFSLSGIVTISDGNKISAGIQGGIVQRSIGNTNVIWDSQITAITFDPSLPNGEVSNFPAFHYPDLSAGVIWSYDKGEAIIFNNNMSGIYAGLAAFHLNRPQQEFYTTDRLNEKIVFTSGCRVGLKNSNISLLPSLLFMNQGKANETNFGLLFRYTIREESKHTGILKEMALSFGGHYRYKDAFIPVLNYEFSHFALGITYDVNVSKLKEASHAKGGIEISLRYINPNPFKATSGTSKSVRFL